MKAHLVIQGRMAGCVHQSSIGVKQTLRTNSLKFGRPMDNLESLSNEKLVDRVYSVARKDGFPLWVAQEYVKRSDWYKAWKLIKEGRLAAAQQLYEQSRELQLTYSVQR